MRFWADFHYLKIWLKRILDGNWNIYKRKRYGKMSRNSKLMMLWNNYDNDIPFRDYFENNYKMLIWARGERFVSLIFNVWDQIKIANCYYIIQDIYLLFSFFVKLLLVARRPCPRCRWFPFVLSGILFELLSVTQRNVYSEVTQPSKQTNGHSAERRRSQSQFQFQFSSTVWSKQ